MTGQSHLPQAHLVRGTSRAFVGAADLNVSHADEAFIQSTLSSRGAFACLGVFGDRFVFDGHARKQRNPGTAFRADCGGDLWLRLLVVCSMHQETTDIGISIGFSGSMVRLDLPRRWEHDGSRLRISKGNSFGRAPIRWTSRRNFPAHHDLLEASTACRV